MFEAEQQYTTGEKELFAVVHAPEFWRCYLDGIEDIAVTDHSPNTFFCAPIVCKCLQLKHRL